MKRSLRRSRLALVVVAAWCAGALAQPTAGSEGDGLAAVRILRTGDGVETLDVWLDERRILAGIELGRPSEYVVVPAGRHELAVASPAGDAPDSAPSAAIGTVALPAGRYATVVVPAGESDDGAGASRSAAARTTPFVVEDPLGDLPPVGSAGLRLVHAAPGRPALALAVREAVGRGGRAPPGWADPPGATRYVARVAPMHGSGYDEVESGTYRLWFVGEQDGAVLPEPVELHVERGALYTVFLAEGPSGRAHVAVSVDATSGASTRRDGSAAAALRLLHASPDAPLVDLLVDGSLTLRDVAPGSPTAYAGVSPGRHLVEVYPHRMPGPMRLGGDGDESRDEEGDASATDAGAEAASERSARADVPRLEPVTVHVDVPPQQYTTLVLAGRFDPLSTGSAPGALSVAVEPTDAEVTVQGPSGIVASSPGPKLLDDLAPGTYRIEVSKPGHRSARYEVDVRPEGTSVVSVTLQRAPDGGEAADDLGEAEGDAEDADAAPTFVQDATAQGVRRRLELHVYTSAIPTAAPGRARVRFVHVAPSVPHLEIVATRAEEGGEAKGPADETIRVERLAYPNAGSYLSVPAAPQTLTFRVSGSRNRLRRLDEVTFRAGVTYTLYLVDQGTDVRFGLVPVVDAIAPQRGPGAGDAE